MFWVVQYLKSLGDNFGHVDDAIYRGAAPSDAILRKLRELGVQNIIDLRDGDQSKAGDRASAAGFGWQQIALRDNARPNARDIEDVLVLLKCGATFFHCEGGRHRSGLIAACYRVRQGWSKRDAWEEAEKYGYYSALGHGPLKDWFWNDFKS